ncbi:trypsin-like peptidase domain-containing protein [Streptomyces sp. NPDC087917]|uniref:trypsin-like serine peptidase n=1 Tax=unclassified Streptomyces TaxID=2593676 RepID=UPI00341456D1
MRRRRGARVGVLVAVCCAALAAGVGLLWPRLFGPLADGDPVLGRYVQDAALADASGAALEGLTRAAPPVGALAPRARGEWRPSEPLEAVVAPTEPAIGALFSPGADWDGDHHCSGSVVHSPGGDLIVTAAHCVYAGGFRTNLAFVPGYRDGSAPYGVWVPTRIEVDPRWVESSDPDHDVAFIRVRRSGPEGEPGPRLEELTGAHPLGIRAALPERARLVGYPNDSEEPLGCANTAEAAGPTQLRLDCADVPNGTSGGPVLSAAGTLIGVIGGRDGGGDEVTSYSSRFGEDARALYERAVRG